MNTISELKGHWLGKASIWLKPDGGLSESELIGSEEIPDKAVILRYNWNFESIEHFGLYVVSSTGPVAFCDSFHTNGDIMHCEPVEDNTVIGHYQFGEEKWGWRTRFEFPNATELIISAWNVFPSGEEVIATRAEYSRFAN